MGQGVRSRGTSWRNATKSQFSLRQRAMHPLSVCLIHTHTQSQISSPFFQTQPDPTELSLLLHSQKSIRSPAESSSSSLSLRRPHAETLTDRRKKSLNHSACFSQPISRGSLPQHLSTIITLFTLQVIIKHFSPSPFPTAFSLHLPTQRQFKYIL